ncbi:MAG: UPF0182 family protein [Chloroflexi bacterium]|nr:UPF0182 family protein [Chloroflexota bacterium]
MRQNGGFPPVGDWGGSLVLPPNTGMWVRITLVAVGLIALLVVANILRAIYTDWLWFDNLGFLDVFLTALRTRVWLFLVGAILFGVMVSTSFALARRHARGESILPLPPETIQWLDRFLLLSMVLGAILLSVIFGVAAANRWDLVLRLLNSASFGTTDPVFAKDIGFFVFTLPVLELLRGWFLGAVIVLLIATAAVYFIHYSIRGVRFQLTPWMRGHLAVLGALVFLGLAADHFIDRYNLLFSPSGAVFGATYADVNARMLALLFLTAIAAASGVLLLVTLLPTLQGARGNRLIMGAVGLWVVAAVGVGNLYPSFVQRFTVEPNEFSLEEPYIARNIELTRAAFGLGRIREETFPVQEELPPEALFRNPEIMNNLRLWDPRPLRDTYNQEQFLRLYYAFRDVDVDRYTIDGEYRQVLIGARELHPENLPEEAQRWVNQRLQYTHGYGAAASPVTEFTPEGRPVFYIKDIPPDPDGAIIISQPEIYYGEHSLNFVIVKSLTDELDYEPDEGAPIYKNYEGEGGITISSLLRRVAYAWQFADINILVSGQITSESRIQYRRTVQERISQVAPFLMLDRDPYLVVDDGRLVWIQDAYTTSDHYPYSTPYRDSFNYIRNSVKVVVDAFHGTLDFYIADPDDPVIQTYIDIFPTLFKPLDEMPDSLRLHVRYPEDFFSIQAEIYLQYHMQDPNQFFNKADQWDVPEEQFLGATRPVVPYYVIMKLPLPEEESPEAEFLLILPFTPWPTADKPRMVAWLAARMDGDAYGELVAFSFPRGAQIDGPNQVEARIDQDFEIKQKFALLCSGEATCIRGNLLVIPIEQSILYVEPLYLQSSAVRFPELKQVILATSKKVVMESTLELAIAALVGQQLSVELGDQSPDGLSPAAGQLRQIEEVLSDLKEGLTTLEDALAQLRKLIEEEEQQ